MNDLPARLRELYVQHGTNYVQEAAREIERLQRTAIQAREALETFRSWGESLNHVLGYRPAIGAWDQVNDAISAIDAALERK